MCARSRISVDPQTSQQPRHESVGRESVKSSLFSSLSSLMATWGQVCQRRAHPHRLDRIQQRLQGASSDAQSRLGGIHGKRIGLSKRTFPSKRKTTRVMQRGLNVNTPDMQDRRQFSSAPFVPGSNYLTVAKNEVCAMQLPGGAICVCMCVCVMSDSPPPPPTLLIVPELVTWQQTERKTPQTSGVFSHPDQ